MRRKTLIATHGYLARGFKSSAEILAGMGESIIDINAYTDEEPGDYTPKIAAFIDGVAEDEEGLIFTDLAGGSVNQKVVCTLAERPGGVPANVFLVTDTNLMSLIALLLESRDLSADLIDELLGQTHATRVQLEGVLGACEDEDVFLD
ncbi:MAG: hypothetical protein SOU51_06560 [Collinsella sp.]|nr:hypothetical protein [Collinsella sp.]